MECFGAFYNYSQQPSPQMYFSWKYTTLFVPRSVTEALHGERKKKKLDSKFCVKVVSDVCSRQPSLSEDKENVCLHKGNKSSQIPCQKDAVLHGYSTKYLTSGQA